MATNSQYGDVATYVNPTSAPLPVKVDVTASNTNPPKADTSFGKPGTKVGSLATANAIGIAPDATNEVRVRASATANTKFAPAKAYATAYGQNSGGGDVFVVAQARATGKPGLQYGALVSNSDAAGVSTGGVADSGNVVVLSTSRATGGQGITVAGARGSATSGKAAWVGVDARANSAKWYMAPGHAVAGGEAFGQGGHVAITTDVRARADLGTATSGVLNVAKSNGAQPIFWDILPVENQVSNGFGNTVFSQTNNDPRSDAGAAIAGTINIGTTAAGKVVLLNDNVEASAAVGEALAGLVNVGVSNDGSVLIGDYDSSDATQNEVIAKVRGRGTAQGGMINIGEWSLAGAVLGCVVVGVGGFGRVWVR